VSDFALIHSTGQSATGWERLVAALDERGRSAHAVDLPTDRPELAADDYAEIMRNQIGGAYRPIVVTPSGSGVLLPAAARALALNQA
jgi:hypothetical protein